MKSRVGAFTICLLVIAGVGRTSAQTPAGDPFVVNSTVVGSTSSPDVAVESDRGFAVVWSTDRNDGNGWGAFARWYDATGTALTGEVRVSPSTAGSQYVVGIDGDSRGNFVIAWVESGRGLIVRRFDRIGGALSDELVVTDSNLGADAAVSANEDGGFVLSWLRPVSPDMIVEARRFGSDGLPLGAVFTVSTFPDDWWREEIAIELRDDNSFLVAWSDGQEIHARIFDGAGNPMGAEFQVSQLDPPSFESVLIHVGSEDTGRFRIFWATDINLEEITTMTRTVTGAGTLGTLTDLDLPSNGLPSCSMTRDGEFVVTRFRWFGARLEGARFGADLFPFPEFEIAPEPDYYLWGAKVAHDGADSTEFVAAWVDEPLPGGPFPAIKARLFRHLLFADGFESGDTIAWSTAVP